MNEPPFEMLSLCKATALRNSGRAVLFDVLTEGKVCRAFAVRHVGQVQAYLNRCGHVPMEMDFVEGEFFDSTGLFLICATHGATYVPATGECIAGPCRRGLVKIPVSEHAGVVRWHTSLNFQPYGT